MLLHKHFDLQNPNLIFSKHIYMGKEQMKKKKGY